MKIPAIQSAEKKLELSEVVIRPIETDFERSQVYRLRYDIYIEEMKRGTHGVDYATKQVFDEMDESAILLGAFYHGRMVGTARLNFSSDTVFSKSDLYQFEVFEKTYPKGVLMITKAMVAKEWRGSMLFFEMVKAMHNIALERNAQVSLLDCNDHLVGTYEKIGFRSYRGRVFDEEYGWVTPMAMLHADETYLREVRSPLLLNLKRFERHAEANRQKVAQREMA
ncbi:MAG: hypothetical protein COV44_03260 [Deltaproteobacteria bacterium CG11_big_fil_rev_8_21_14_0_20_45_16]|nr:MAG: hypothetical protein COV44_03260 [Deltaproteobacteria bacterium CG11_big_fil_rev_8_21_14_0_20_45_16]